MTTNGRELGVGPHGSCGLMRPSRININFPIFAARLAEEKNQARLAAINRRNGHNTVKIAIQGTAPKTGASNKSTSANTTNLFKVIKLYAIANNIPSDIS